MKHLLTSTLALSLFAALPLSATANPAPDSQPVSAEVASVFDTLSLERIADCEFVMESFERLIRGWDVQVAGLSEYVFADIIDGERRFWRAALLEQSDRRGVNPYRVDSPMEETNALNSKIGFASDSYLQAVRQEAKLCIEIATIGFSADTNKNEAAE